MCKVVFLYLGQGWLARISKHRNFGRFLSWFRPLGDVCVVRSLGVVVWGSFLEGIKAGTYRLYGASLGPCGSHARWVVRPAAAPRRIHARTPCRVKPGVITVSPWMSTGRVRAFCLSLRCSGGTIQAAMV